MPFRLPACLLAASMLVPFAAAPIEPTGAVRSAPQDAATGDAGVDAKDDAATDAKSPAFPRRELKKPEQVKFRSRDGKRVNGKVVAFDGDAFEGPASGEGALARTPWSSVHADDLESLAGRILDEKDVDELILKGELLMSIGRVKPADAAFDRAERAAKALKGSAASEAGARIAAARTRGADRLVDAEHDFRMTRHAEMSSRIPKTEGGVAPWPVLAREEHEAAVAAMKKRAEEICQVSGMQAVPVETRYFLLYAATKREAVEECARSLDAMYEKVLELFGIPAGLNLFWGKAVILLQPSEEKFRLVEQAAFGAMVPRGVVGLCHQVGPQVFVNIFWTDDQDRFDSVLLHETVHGIVHRYHSPARLPDWANEGLSEYIAAVSFKSSPVDKERRPQALDFIRGGGNVAEVMRYNYRDGSWPGPNAIGYAVGYVIVELMIRQQPDRFGAWLRAIKGGKDWERALVEDFGYTVDQFGARAVEFYRKSK
jgi:hypothetical protein